MIQAADYTAEKLRIEGEEVIRLAEAGRHAEVLIAPFLGNNAYAFRINGRNIFWSPYQTLAEWKAKPVLLGNPLLAPWANRLDSDAFHANGKVYKLNGDLRNFRRDGNGQPIHGLLAYASEWRLEALEANEGEAMARCRLEFWRHPDRMAQFPFAHSIEMTYRLREGSLEVETLVENHSTDPMPLSLGYHPYFQLPGVPRDDWEVVLPARSQVVLSGKLTPTGETRPYDGTKPLRLRGAQLDDVFTDLIRDVRGRASFQVRGAGKSISVEYGPNYPVAVVYAPPGRDFICFEPMAGVTNHFNLAQQGHFRELLQVIAPGGRWRESYWIQPAGF